jgi:hypothetical protein
MKERFNDFGLTSEQLGEATAQMFIQTTLQYNKDAITATNSMMKLEAEEPIKQAQEELTRRQTQGYDDNLLVKTLEQRGSVATFNVNSSPETAQPAIDSMNQTVERIEKRVQPLEDGEATTTLPADVPTPLSLGVDTQTDTTITVSWATVINATSYELFLDGVSIATTGQSIQTIDSLTANTKYAFNVRAYIDDRVSELSPTVIGTTNATP